MFDKKSRYAAAERIVVTDPRGRDVEVVVPPIPSTERSLGIHRHREGERLDHLAARYLGDAAGFWRLAEHNDAMTADVLAEAREIDIPGGG